MINDGFNEFMTVDGSLVMFRPLSLRDRVSLVSPIRELGEEWLFEIARRCIAWQNGSFEMTVDVASKLIGCGNYNKDKADCIALFKGVRLAVMYPRLNRVSCEVCKNKWFDPIRGEFTVINNGVPEDRDGPTLCEVQKNACPVGHHQKPTRLSGKYKNAFDHYLECSASSFPDDSIVRRNARVIYKAIRSCQSKN